MQYLIFINYSYIECSSSDNCLQEVYHGEILQTLSESSNLQLNSPRIISSTPKDMDSNVSVLSSIVIHVSSSMHRGNGNGSLQSQDGMIINELFMKTNCIGAMCTISFNNPLQSNSFYQLELDADFFINEYNLPVQDSFRLLFKTNSQSCGVQSIQDGFDNSHLCSCFSDHNACLCDCGAVQINRGF